MDEENVIFGVPPFLLEAMGRSFVAEDFVNRDVHGNLAGLRELRIGAAIASGKSELLLAARFMQSGYDWSMLDLMLQFGSEDLVRELVSIGVPVLQPENILPKSSLSLTTKVAIAILDASASPMLLNSFRICWSHPDGMWERFKIVLWGQAGFAYIACYGIFFFKDPVLEYHAMFVF